MECTMKIGILEFLEKCGLMEPLYPGKRIVRKLLQPGEFKSHCIVYDWHAPETLRVEVKAGLSGRALPNKELSKYPVSFQAPTFVEFAIANDEDEGDEDSESESAGGSGDSRALKRKPESPRALSAFGTVAEGRVPDYALISQLVVMGKQIAREAFAPVLEALAAQIRAAKIAQTDLLARAGKFITKYTPAAALQPRGDEDVVYKYDREKNEPMFGKPAIG